MHPISARNNHYVTTKLTSHPASGSSSDNLLDKKVWHWTAKVKQMSVISNFSKGVGQAQPSSKSFLLISHYNSVCHAVVTPTIPRDIPEVN
jgi:hypothetical protein